MQEERCENYRSRDMSRSRPYAGRNSAKHECIVFYRVSEREKYTNDIRTACQFEIQIWEPTFLVQRILRRYGGENAKKIEEYIANQLQEDLEYDQMTLKEYIDPFTGEPVKQNR